MGWFAISSDLLEAVRILSLVPAESGQPSSDFFLAEQLNNKEIRLTTASTAVADVKVRGEGEWPFKKPFFIQRNLFSNFITAVKDPTGKSKFELSNLANRLIVKHGERTLVLDSRPAIMGYAGLPTLKKPSQLDFSPELTSLLNCAATCADKQSDIGCIYMSPLKKGKGVELMATNQQLILQIWAKTNGIGEPIPFPVSLLNVLKAEGLKSLQWETGCILADFGTGKVWQTTSVPAAEQFPLESMRTTIEDGLNGPVLFRVPLKELVDTMDRLTYYLQSTRKEDWVMNLIGKKDVSGISVVTRLPYSVIKEKLKCSAKRDFNFSWPLDLLAPMLQAIPNGDNKEVQVRLGEDISYVTCGEIELAISSKVI